MKNLDISQLKSVGGGYRFTPELIACIFGITLLRMYQEKAIAQEAFIKGYKAGYADGATGVDATH